MREESPKPASTPTGAVFVSYASQDAEAAHRICAALRSAGVEVWFDQSELRGGDAWDQSIRKQIKTCTLFLPVISHTTHDRREGYFRLEWKLAIDRSHLMDANLAFLLPVVIDDTRDDDERVPERFREVQWTRLPGGVAPASFVERVRRLLSGEPAQEPTRTSAVARVTAAPSTRKPVLASWRSKAALLATIAVLVVALGYLVANRLVLSKRGAEVGAASAPAAQSAPATAFNPPPHSIAVLPFVNLSGDPAQEYFSDGLTEELLNSLARINELQVAARTSAFSFKGKDTDIDTIARKLNVGAIMEGSVRRSGHTVRITAQLINAVSGFHLWSETYDRNLGDVLKLQAEIATAVASSLKVALLTDPAAKIEFGGTRNPNAFDAYLHGAKFFASYHDEKDLQAAIEAFNEAIRMDPRYALAFAARSRAILEYAGQLSPTPEIRKRESDRARDDAQQAVAIAPELAEGHLALAQFFENGPHDFSRASAEYQRARVLAPGNASILRLYGYFMARMGHTEAGLTALRRAVVLDPLDRAVHRFLADALFDARQYDAAITAIHDTLAIDPHDPYTLGLRGITYYALGRFEIARDSCVSQPEYWTVQQCLALAYDKLGRRPDAEAALTKLQATTGDNAAYQYAEIYAQWGNPGQALNWLETALRLRDPGLYSTKVDPLLDPLRSEPRFQAIERELSFPN